MSFPPSLRRLKPASQIKCKHLRLCFPWTARGMDAQTPLKQRPLGVCGKGRHEARQHPAAGHHSATRAAAAPGRAALGLVFMIFHLHVKSQLWPEAVRALLIQSELTLCPRELRQRVQAAVQVVQAAGTGSAGDPSRVGSSSERGAPLQTGRSSAALCLMLEQKQSNSFNP